MSDRTAVHPEECRRQDRRDAYKRDLERGSALAGDGDSGAKDQRLLGGLSEETGSQQMLKPEVAGDVRLREKEPEEPEDPALGGIEHAVSAGAGAGDKVAAGNAVAAGGRSRFAHCVYKRMRSVVISFDFRVPGHISG